MKDIQNSVSKSQEWLANFKKKINQGIAVPDKYIGNVTHKRTVFYFTVGTDDYLIICPAAKIGANSFCVYKDGVKIYTKRPQGRHVNKTNAEYALRLAINYHKKHSL